MQLLLGASALIDAINKELLMRELLLWYSSEGLQAGGDSYPGSPQRHNTYLAEDILHDAHVLAAWFVIGAGERSQSGI